MKLPRTSRNICVDRTAREPVAVGTVRLRLAGASLLGGVALLLGPCASAAVVYDAAGDFSPTSNPNGVWSLGFQYPTLGAGFTLESSSGSVAGLDYWASNPGPILPGAFHNPTGSTIYYGGSAVIEAGQLVLHPGQLGEYSVARFTAPAAGSYSFSADFIGQDSVYGTTTDVHLLVNNAIQYSGIINGYHNTASSGAFVLSLNPGDTIDVAVGFGANGTFWGDTTGVDFRVTYVPAPGAAALLGLGGLVGARRRRG